MNRKLSVKEIEWLNKGLANEHRYSGLDIEKYLSQIDSLRVVDECDCGDPECYSVRFQNYSVGSSVGFADGIINQGKEEAFTVILFLNSETGMISELETIK